MAEQAITQGAIRLVQYLRLQKQRLTPSRSIFDPSGCFVEQPVLQCVQIKTMEPKAGDANPVQRFRVVLSDIRNFIQTMIATSM
jgi:replication factor A1